MTEKPCTKKRHESETAAREHNSGMEPYYCPQCKAWHLTSGMAGRLNRAKMVVQGHVVREWADRKSQRRKRRKP